MERFVELIVGGGVVLVAGLWTVTLFATGSAPWLVGGLLVLVGVAGLAAGIRREIEG